MPSLAMLNDSFKKKKKKIQRDLKYQQLQKCRIEKGVWGRIWDSELVAVWSRIILYEVPLNWFSWHSDRLLSKAARTFLYPG